MSTRSMPGADPAARMEGPTRATWMESTTARDARSYTAQAADVTVFRSRASVTLSRKSRECDLAWWTAAVAAARERDARSDYVVCSSTARSRSA
jgi:hypothetical protein